MRSDLNIVICIEGESLAIGERKGNGRQYIARPIRLPSALAVKAHEK